jgi:hypothetical protein
MKPRRPNTKTIKKVLEWLQEHNLSVYGDNIDPESGLQSHGCRDYSTVEDIIKIAKHFDNGTVSEEGGE